MKRIVLLSVAGMLVLFCCYLLWANYYLRQENNRNNQQVIPAQYPKVLFAKASCESFDRDMFNSKAKIIVSNPSTIFYSSVSVMVYGHDKNDNVIEEQQVTFSNIDANKAYSKIVYLKHKARSATCAIINFN